MTAPYAAAGVVDRTAAQVYAYLVGAVLVVVGLVGFLASATFGAGSPPPGDELIVFLVNGWHNLVHVASGVFLLAVAPRRGAARKGVLAFALLYTVVTIWGFVDGDDFVALVPINTADNLLHLALAALALVIGAASPDDGSAGSPRTGTIARG